MPAPASSQGTDEPIHIKADQVTLDERRGVSHFRGNVEFRRGAMDIHAEEVTVFQLPDQTLDRIFVQGAPATFRRTGAPEEEIRAEARRMEYFAAREALTLLGNARVWQGPNQFSAPRIEYDMVANTVRAAGSTEENGRVETIITPRRDERAQ